MSFLKKYQHIILIAISIVLYFFFAYFLERTQFNILVLLWFSLFGCFYLLMKTNKISFSNLVGISIIFRLIFLFAIPNLSQDFYRFIWDGRMILEGLNPYLSLPETFIQQNNYPIAEAAELYSGMGELNGSHYTNYPPLNQLCFLIAAIFSSKSIFGSVIVLRVLIILADLGILYFGKKLLEKINLPIKNIFWYVLNPFIIIEMTGNLHFEPVMLFFFIFGMYQIHQQKWIWAAILIGCSISVKLIPLLFLPLFFQWFVNQKKTSQVSKTCEVLKLLGFYLIIILTVIILFLPFLSSELLSNYSKSVGLWFGKFEFNASFYYIFREIGYLFRGYNEIAIIGKITPILTILFLLFLTFFRKNSDIKQLFTVMLFSLCFYYFTSTTVHPWYLATPIILSVFTKYKFSVVWSLFIILSYQAYANNPWQENLWFVALEYIIVLSYLFYEIVNKTSKKNYI
ncbi:mannosyltransferase [Polaribacter reichenbachii]|uniref:Mannosyltransferase n=1 Tax=Polaribacter reichenbachii TaxID=996801 RepID=A0A1B8TVS0_9FLAO|nr:mannosyltransferase [Polaribacter reichenbachii]APZ45291.1 mannosyltransferase [Polaribacter reichenbachii]AUC19153.1 mannosyltransferase [Polaribacter reichenbachii]OBY63690.1 mannosyltransferase [Polaribacter reichenbachii]